MCGLCGNFDGNAENDFIKHNGEVVTNPEDFGDSWKENPTCLDLTNIVNDNGEKENQIQAEKQCQILRNDVFKECHSLVSNSINYFLQKLHVMCHFFTLVVLLFTFFKNYTYPLNV